MSRPELLTVVKISKFCNLRCTYCYEFNELGDKTPMSLDQIRAMFVNLRDYALEEGITRLGFAWHGGEPLVIKPDYYRAIQQMQREVFGDRLIIRNAVQTNLTILNDEVIDFLKNGGFFSSIGVSFDVYGDERVDIRGRSSADKVLDNMQRLVDAGIPFGIISVLSRKNLARAGDMARFFDRLGVSAQFSPFYRSASPSQVEAHAVDGEDLTEALKDVIDAWLGSTNVIALDPVADIIDDALAALAGQSRPAFDRAADEHVLIVNTNGDAWNSAEAYDPEFKLGNAFTQPIRELVNAPARARAIAESEQLMRQHCAACPFFGACSGQFVADSTPQQQLALAQGGCGKRALIEHTLRRFDETGAAAQLAAPAAA